MSTEEKFMPRAENEILKIYCNSPISGNNEHFRRNQWRAANNVLENSWYSPGGTTTNKDKSIDDDGALCFGKLIATRTAEANPEFIQKIVHVRSKTAENWFREPSSNIFWPQISDSLWDVTEKLEFPGNESHCHSVVAYSCESPTCRLNSVVNWVYCLCCITSFIFVLDLVHWVKAEALIVFLVLIVFLILTKNTISASFSGVSSQEAFLMCALLRFLWSLKFIKSIYLLFWVGTNHKESESSARRQKESDRLMHNW